MKIILAFDSFKGSLSSAEVSVAASQGIKQVLPNAEIKSFLISDGGEGFTDAFSANLHGDKITCRVHNPLMQPIDASYFIVGDMAIMELASAAGLTLLKLEERNPMDTTTFGVGEMIVDALNKACRRFIIGLGGSATNDAGTGILSALGYKFLDKDGKVLEPKGKNLLRIKSIDSSDVIPLIEGAEFTFTCDVSNPFCGIDGATFIYSEQKGASPIQKELLEVGMRNYAKVINQNFGIDLCEIPMTGAAGGVSGGVMPFLNTTLTSGIEALLDALNFDEEIRGADLIITGEGKIDGQTAKGKAINGILSHAKKENIPVIAIAGQIENLDEVKEMGFADAICINPKDINLDEAMNPIIAFRNVKDTIANTLKYKNKI